MGNIDGGSPGDWSAFDAIQRMKSRRIENALHKEQLDALQRKRQEDEGVAALARRAFGGVDQQAPQEEGPEQLSGPIAENTAAAQTFVAGKVMAGQSLSIADQLDNLARLSAGSGYITKAQEVAKTAATLRARAAAADSSANSAALSRIRAAQRDSQLVGQLFGNVTDQASMDRAVDLYEFRTGQRSELRGAQYDPTLIRRVQDEAITAKDRADLQEKELTRDAQKRYRDARLGQIDTQNNIRQQRVDLERQREERLAKQGGGKAITAPSQQEQSQAERLVKQDFSGMESRDAKDAAYSIAAEARALRRANPALDANQALQQAYAAAKAAGDFQTDEGFGGIGIKKKTTYTGRGKTPDLPASLPPKKAALQKGRYYTNPQGQVARWNGTGFELANAGAGGEADDTENDDDEDDDE